MTPLPSDLYQTNGTSNTVRLHALLCLSEEVVTLSPLTSLEPKHYACAASNNMVHTFYQRFTEFPEHILIIVIALMIPASVNLTAPSPSTSTIREVTVNQIEPWPRIILDPLPVVRKYQRLENLCLARPLRP